MPFPLDVLRSPAPQALERLLIGWFGSRPIPDRLVVDAPTLPAALADTHRVLSAYPKTFYQNHLEPIDRLQVVDHRVVFLRESQNVCAWAIDVDDITP